MAHPTKLDIEQASQVVVCASTRSQAQTAFRYLERTYGVYVQLRSAKIVTPNNLQDLSGYGGNALFIRVTPILWDSLHNTKIEGVASMQRRLSNYQAIYNNVRTVQT